LQIPTPFDAKCCRKDIYGGFSNIPNPEIVLDFDLRRWRLMEVLLEDDYDIIAMEEVDRFHGFFEPLLNILGYQGLFTPKPFSPGVSMGWYSDGCALFWKKDTLELLKEEKGAYEMGSGSQVYTIATMRHVATDRVLVVAMTHLKAGKTIENEIVRVGQVEELLGAVQASAQNAAKLGNIALDEIPVVVAGDFNSDPKENNSCIRGIQSKDSIYPMKSAYEVDSITHSSMFTTWKTRGDMTVKRIIDYIFHNAGVTKGFDCSHTLQNPVDYEVEETRLPGFKYPSDHIAVGAKFKLER
jgi:mRNA deadenylase 3'-5' endonuclease subunit Ccr4